MPPPTVPAESFAPGDTGPHAVSQRRILLPVATGAFLAVNVLDIVLTVVLLYRGGHREANPIAEYILNHWGWEKMALYKLATTAIVCLIAHYVARHRRPPRRRR